MSDSRDEWGERLPRRLGLLGLIAVVISLTFGSGIFRVPASVAATLQSPGLILTAWIAGAAIAIVGALTLAELGAALPRSGGYFVALEAAFGPAVAFTYGWAELTVISPAALGAISFVVAQYLGYFVPMSPETTRVVAAATVLVATALAYAGVRTAALVSGVSTVAKYVGLFLLIALAALLGKGDAGHFIPPFGVSNGVGVSAFLTALLAIMFAFDGWGDGLRIAGDVRNPARNVPLGMFVAVGLVGVIYVLANVAYMWLLPVSDMASSPFVAASAAERIPVLGGIGARFVAGLVVVSAFGTVVASALAMPRTQFVMADRGLFFQRVGRLSPRFQSPSVATWTIGAISILFVFAGDFQRLADRMVLGLWPFYVLCAIGVFILRRRRPELARPYRAWGFPVVTAAFIGVGLALMINALWHDPTNTAITFALLAAGLPIYWGWRKAGGRRGRNDGTTERR